MVTGQNPPGQKTPGHKLPYRNPPKPKTLRTKPPPPRINFVNDKTFLL